MVSIMNKSGKFDKSNKADKSKPDKSNGAAFNPARRLAVRVLLRVLQDDVFAAPTLDQALRETKLSARDAKLATHIVYGTLRRHRSLNHVLDTHLSGKTHPKARTLLLAAAFEKLHMRTPPHAVVSEYVSLARVARWAPPSLVNAVLRKIAGDVGDAGDAEKETTELPDWLFERYQQVFTTQTAQVLADLLNPQPLWLKASARGIELLQQEECSVTHGVQGTVQVQLSRSLRETRAYQEGQVQPINPASLSCVDALGEVASTSVLDLAGGAGIKAAMLLMRGARVISVDLAAHKHVAAAQNLERLGLLDSLQSVQTSSNPSSQPESSQPERIRFVTHDLTKPFSANPLTPAPALEPFTHVLLDAPCTGSGTLRAHPEIALRLTPSAVAEMAHVQQQMLEQAAQNVALGGLLVYSVCSVLPEEGVQVVQRFLTQHPEFRPLPFEELECPALPLEVGHLTLPLDGVDGFYIARMSRDR